MNNLNEDVRGVTMCHSKAGLAIGSTAKQVAIAAPNGAGIDYSINGKMYHKADAASVAITAAAVQAALYTCLYLVCLDSSGNLTTVKGTAVLSAELSAGSVVLDYPEPTADTCPIGVLKVVTASTATFTAGTTDLDATNVTTTYEDLATIPPEPKTS